MSHVLIDSIVKANEVRTGHASAQQTITEALIVTLLQASPHLINQMGNHLEELSAAQRTQLGHEGSTSRTAFDAQILQTLGLLDALKGI